MMDKEGRKSSRKQYVAPRLVELTEGISSVALGAVLSDVAATADVAALPADAQQAVLDLASQFT